VEPADPVALREFDIEQRRAEGARKLEALDDDGPTSTGFNFAACFDPAGRKIAA